MKIKSIEIKARCSSPEFVRNILMENNVVFKGEDRQVDTYFKVSKGRLKLREGNIENALIYYQRNDTVFPKGSEILLQELKAGDGLQELLKKALEIMIIVDKRREIYFIDNVKFHLDQVEGLGSFVEIEALDTTGSMDEKTLNESCRYFMELLKVKQDELINCSYSDLLGLKNNNKT